MTTEKQLNKLFLRLLVPGCTSISSERINSENVPMSALKILMPLLKEMDEMNESLDREEFIDSCLSLLSSLSFYDR